MNLGHESSGHVNHDRTIRISTDDILTGQNVSPSGNKLVIYILLENLQYPAFQRIHLGTYKGLEDVHSDVCGPLGVFSKGGLVNLYHSLISSGNGQKYTQSKEELILPALREFMVPIE